MSSEGKHSKQFCIVFQTGDKTPHENLTDCTWKGETSTDFSFHMPKVSPHNYKNSVHTWLWPTPPSLQPWQTLLEALISLWQSCHSISAVTSVKQMSHCDCCGIHSFYQAILDCSNLSEYIMLGNQAAERRSFPDWAVDIWERLEYEGLGRKMHKDVKIAVWEWKKERSTGLGKWGCREVNVDKRGKHTS